MGVLYTLARRATDDYGPQLNYTIWFLTAISFIFLALRIYCKIWRNRSVWWDDYILILSWAALAGSASMIAVCVGLGYGKHNADISQDVFSRLLLYSNAAGFCSILAAVWSKTSFAITLLRISDGWTKRFVWFVIITVNLVLGTTSTVQWIQCSPIERLWIADGKGTCWPRQLVININVAAAAYSGAMDIILALLPWKIVWRVAIDKREKIGALFAMSMGVFAGITSLLKILFIGSIASQDIINSVNLLIFGTAEGAITIMACSIPILRALLQHGRRSHREPTFVDQNNWISIPSPTTEEDKRIGRDTPSSRGRA